jgi:hypothetical protein
MMKKLFLILLMIILAGCSYEGSASPEKPNWYFIKSPTGNCYEYTNMLQTPGTIGGQIDSSYCK